ncbi:MAG: hypothetical protein JWQ33_2927 [Ramlibacter sp.]|nr:hypothetical protein [Ramlibacter sp.]
MHPHAQLVRRIPSGFASLKATRQEAACAAQNRLKQAHALFGGSAAAMASSVGAI